MPRTSGVMVTNTPDVLTEEVADTALGLLSTRCANCRAPRPICAQGRWESEGAYPLTGATLRGRRVGIFGMGRIGQAIAQAARSVRPDHRLPQPRQVEGWPMTTTRLW